MDKKIVIFGSGKLGHEALLALGNENVECLCDNNPELTGKEKYGKRVISFDELKEKYSDATIMICADWQSGNAYAISEQCEENGIVDYFFCQSIRENEIFLKQTELLTFLENPANRVSMKNEILIEKIKGLQKQIDYLKKHADIRYMKPAKGALRERQLDVVKTSAEFLSVISDLGITPFLDNGSLLGYVRHNGFIPWDDDIDFGLMREEYEKLKSYCMTYMYTEEEFADRTKSDKKVKAGLENFYWSHNGGDEFNIYTYSSKGRKVAVDFLPLDYYAENYSFDELKRFVIKVREQLNNFIFNNEKRIACFQAALKENSDNIVKESNNIYFGIDNLTIMYRYYNGTYIPRDLLFPLKKAVFEGETFWIPNRPEEFLEHEYGNIWEFPNDVGIPKHVQISEDDE